MRTSIKIMAMMLSMIAVAFGTTSCGEEDNDPLDVKSVNAEYSLELSQLWFDFYDIDVTYYDQAGKENTVRVTEKWSYGFSVKPKDAPRNYKFTVVATPKKEHPEINGSQYVLSENIVGEFYGIRYDGSTYKELWSDLSPYTVTEADVLTFSSAQFKDYLDGGSRKLMDFTKTFDGNY